jgi:ketosteroid isomerase-like protein
MGGAGVAVIDAAGIETSSILIVRAAFHAFDKRDLSALVELTDPEVELFAPTAALANDGRCYRGHRGLARYLRDVERVWTSLHVLPEKFREVGNHVVCLGRTRALGRDGIEVDSPTAWVWELRGSKLTWGCVYADPGSTFMGLSFGAGQRDGAVPQGSREAAPAPLGTV